ncbi:DUF3291 domain-containing protein [Spirilliplanes yamanashiensis]|uniref:DUF3291 domain-containing protein n=1 Tax=Spirilliplanes yamanashiensis TaxID=42233 RepID=A0A8J3YBN1_9ACTN|nr:DUF3291 domain-containing protein [Spirilliplanes yamanashiensis]MDP9817956.1 hypothetical protein [Spirilliplanes yamanashiensis]GIJ04765.1 hypothetical protein Sya03_41170 [Spirilliplanes yamanashiensis]
MPELAQVNVARLRPGADLETFRAGLEPVFRRAREAPGFVWHLGEDSDVPVRDGMLVNVSMWRSYDDLYAFTYRQADHTAFLRRRAEWFLPPEPPVTALWWMPSGRRPSLSGALRRLAALRADGPTPRVFSPRHRFTPDGQPVTTG